jgi:lysozyme
MGSPQGFSRYPLWVASYRNDAPKMPNGGWEDYTLWQFTETYPIGGKGENDMSIFKGSYEDLLNMAGY